MNQITLDVKLYSEGTDDDILSFQFENSEGRINLNSDSCQSQLKDVFSKLIKLSLDNNVDLRLIIDDDYGRGLYVDVCTDYIKELQNELNRVREKIRREMKA